ncbi:uncharacterized protein LOC122304584 [Carya illinoinensis]|uniref:uncharacterized protein LOC122304584 n=1 Tax=Carya illinoinensis TaxID=32201 RepID=UPI001C71C5FA|nr:uncharacterized protein LOC122304584 [Carya illinoinensis]
MAYPLEGHEVILVVVHQLSKYAHFIPLYHPYTTKLVAKAFVNNIVKLHGFPRTIVSDRDRVFMSSFWRQLFELQGSQLKRSSSYHPQTDGQSEVVNRTLEQYLRCFSDEELPPLLVSYERGLTSNNEVEKELINRDEVLAKVKRELKKAQSRMKKYHDQGRVLEKLGSVAYKLQLPPTSQLPLVFHVSLLKNKVGDPSLIGEELPTVDQEGRILMKPKEVLG